MANGLRVRCAETHVICFTMKHWKAKGPTDSLTLRRLRTSNRLRSIPKDGLERSVHLQRRMLFYIRSTSASMDFYDSHLICKLIFRNSSLNQHKSQAWCTPATLLRQPDPHSSQPKSSSWAHVSFLIRIKGVVFLAFFGHAVPEWDQKKHIWNCLHCGCYHSSDVLSHKSILQSLTARPANFEWDTFCRPLARDTLPQFWSSSLWDAAGIFQQPQHAHAHTHVCNIERERETECNWFPYLASWGVLCLFS